MPIRQKLLIILLFGILVAAPAASQTNEEGSDTDTEATIETAAQELQANQQQIADKEAEIDELNRRIEELQGKSATADSEAELIEDQLTRIKEQLAKAQLELKQTQLSINAVEEEQQSTEEQIAELEASLGRLRGQIKGLLRLLYLKEQTPLFTVFLGEGRLSELLAERAAIKEIQDRGVELMNQLRDQEKELQEQQAALEQQAADLGELHQLLAVQENELAEQRGEQDQFLSAKRAEQAEYEQKIAAAKRAREEIEQDIFTLKDAGVELSLTEATDMAKFASQLTGVRPALLLAVLKVESDVGNSIGTGTFPDDMQPASREPFLRITAKLGLDPATAPISRRPAGGWGWGGAMGPAQVMPQTWEGIEPRLAQLMNKPTPNPYELTDAFVATALMLADRGAANPANEYEAVNRYIAGPNWQRFTWYGDRVLAIAKEYEKEGI